MNLIDKWKLGILYKDGNIVNHRSLLKVAFNPILRYLLCLQIATEYDTNSKKLGKLILMKTDHQKWINSFNSWNDHDFREKKRLLI